MVRKKKADLYLLGLGINGVDQLTREVEEVLRKCRVVFHISYSHNELTRLNPNVISLDDEYWTDEPHRVVYARLIRRIMSEVERGPGVASVTYGHPIFFDNVHTNLRNTCARKKLNCVVLPGISSLDTLSVDLNIDYGDGLTVLEATTMVDNQVPPNPDLHTLIFQIGEYGMSTTNELASDDADRFLSMQNYLLNFYEEDHPIVLATSDRGEGVELIRSRLRRLNSHRNRIQLGSTMYLPPACEWV
ncbi:MAG: SAM-dependent methyltransferase [Proteobacteria bacterium]|nr:SAM-dependent methyltransferase [Pseudomonadota bacterium]